MARSAAAQQQLGKGVTHQRQSEVKKHTHKAELARDYNTRNVAGNQTYTSKVYPLHRAKHVS